MVLIVVALLATSYLLGSIPFGLIVGRSQGIDIRHHGSHNIGATNVWRVLGKTYGLLTFACDAGKGIAAVVLARVIAAHWPVHYPLPHGHERIDYLPPDFAGITAALGCVLGHSFPVWLGFRGGKSVATSLGVIFGMMPLAGLLTLAVWGAVLKVSRYVSLASLVAAAALPVIVIALMFLWPARWWGAVMGWGNFYFACAAAALVIVRHRGNIQRLTAGTESRVGSPPKSP